MSGLSEQAKYEEMWSHPEYRAVSPGEGCAIHFLSVAKPRAGSTIIDFGCGTGRGSMMLGVMGPKLKIRLVDFAKNCLDEEMAQALETQKDTFDFTQADLSKPIPLTAEYGFCTDVMEHIPPDQVDLVLDNIMRAAQHVFFQISCQHDSCGKLIGEELHLSVHPGAWWLAKLNERKCNIHHFEDFGDCVVIYATAWSTGKEVVDIGTLNIAEEQIRRNVRQNILNGWRQVQPHAPSDKEVMLVGGGPSLAGQLDEIKRMRAEGALLVTMNGAYNWALENGLKVSGQIVVDARPHNARFTKPVMPGVHYMLGSQCDPAVFEELPKEQVYMWHTTAESIRDILEELYRDPKDPWFGIVGGCTVLLRAMPLLRLLGYEKFHLFGCDSCCIEGSHHAYAQAENDGVPIFPVIVGGRTFDCHAWQIAQAQEFMDLIRVMGNMFEIEVHGDGLLRWILQTGHDLDVESELDNKRAPD